MLLRTTRSFLDSLPSCNGLYLSAAHDIKPCVQDSRPSHTLCSFGLIRKGIDQILRKNSSVHPENAAHWLSNPSKYPKKKAFGSTFLCCASCERNLPSPFLGVKCWKSQLPPATVQKIQQMIDAPLAIASQCLVRETHKPQAG